MNQNARNPPFQALRILLINWRDPKNPEAGGAEVHLHEVARRLVSEGFTCIQISHYFPGAKREEIIDGVKILRHGGKFLFNFTVWKNLQHWCDEHRIDAVLDDSNKIAFFAPLRCNRPVVLQLHHLFGKALFRETAWPMALYVLFFENLMPRAYRGIATLTGSRSSQQELRDKGFNPVDIAAEGVELSGYVLSPPPTRRKGLVLYVGRVKRYKGLDVLLHALVSLRKTQPAAHLVVAGSGDDTHRLKQLAQSLGLNTAVEFLGFVDEKTKVRLYHEAEVVVNSSLKEGWGLTSIEANACGTPVVATDVPGLCDSVQHEVTGFLIPFGNAKAFAEAIEKLLSDAALWQKFSNQARAWANQHTWEPAYQITREKLLQAYAGAHARV